MLLPLFGLFERKINILCEQPWNQVHGSVPVPQHSCVVESQLPPWEAESGGNSNHLTHTLFSNVLALALGSFADLCGASFPYFQEGRTALTRSGNADSSHSEK